MGRGLGLGLILLPCLLTCARAVELFNGNLAYRSPFDADIKLAHDTAALHWRGLESGLARRQVTDATKYKDGSYPGFYSSHMGNAPLVWDGGLNFTHSVASGDPYDTSVILWTRAVAVSPSGSSSLPDQSVPVCVSYKVSQNQDMSGTPASSGQAFTSYDVDFTVKVEAQHLRADTVYFYQFADCTNPDTVSPIGRTRTLANRDTPADRVNGGKPLTLAVFSCSQYQSGWFNAYGFAANKTQADLFIHLGDYIYESLGSGAKIGRAVLGRELATIADYRLRLNQYRTDQSLVTAHQNAPWITVWDDHEVADNAWKAGTADSNDTSIGCSFSPSGACFTDRKLAAIRAYHEWMPIRTVDPDDQLRIWRNFQIGKLLDLSMLDTRQYDRDLTDVYYNREFVATVAGFDGRSLMGAKQEQWLFNTLSESKARGAVWRVISQQIVFSNLNQSGSFNLDAWSGYRANRGRVLNHISKNRINNAVILAGDSHANWVSELVQINSTTFDPITGNGAVAVEFAGTAVTSKSSFGSGISPAAADVISRGLVSVNPELQWSEGSYRGFFTLTIDTHTLSATYYGMNNTANANLDGFPLATFSVKSGANKLSRPVAGGSVNAGALKLNGTSV